MVGEIEHALSGAGFCHQKNLAPGKYDRLTSFWYQLTSTRNWPVCHQLKLQEISHAKLGQNLCVTACVKDGTRFSNISYNCT